MYEAERDKKQPKRECHHAADGKKSIIEKQGRQ